MLTGVLGLPELLPVAERVLVQGVRVGEVVRGPAEPDVVEELEVELEEPLGRRPVAPQGVEGLVLILPPQLLHRSEGAAAPPPEPPAPPPARRESPARPPEE